MADRGSSYIAWDGVLYDGSPPSGWYLAADNRWWPPQELIESGGQPPEEPYDFPSDEMFGNATTHDQRADDQTFGGYGNNPSASGTEPPGNTDYQTPSPPESWAPHSGTGDGAAQGRTELPPRPVGKPGQGPRSRPNRRSKRKGGFRPGFIIPLVVFGLLRCSSSFDSGPSTIDSDFPDEVFEVENPFDEGDTFTVEGNLIKISGDIDLFIEITECGPSDISLIIHNTEPEEASGTFEVELLLVELDETSPEPTGEPFIVSWRGPVGTEPVQATPLIPDEVGPIRDCQVIDAAVREM